MTDTFKNWTASSIYCYKRGCRCSGCYIKEIMNEVEKITNFQRIKAMDIDEMVEFFTQEYDSDFGDGYCIPRICYDCKLYPTCDKFKENLKLWLESEVRE